MKHLYAPWRSDYTVNTARTKNENGSIDDCVFCQQLADHHDEKHFILRRFEHNAVLLNRYPYNAGHLLIIPCAHEATLPALSPQARIALFELATHSYTIVTEVLKAHGVNMGINFGKAAGAGIPAHLHLHVLPRFNGDTNFLPTLAETKPISFDLNNVYQQLKPAFDKI
jgi:ATP adenylyltransferase